MAQVVDDRMAYSVKEIGALTGLSRNTVYGLIADDVIKATRVGRKLLISRRELERFLGDGSGSQK